MSKQSISGKTPEQYAAGAQAKKNQNPFKVGWPVRVTVGKDRTAFAEVVSISNAKYAEVRGPDLPKSTRHVQFLREVW